MRLTPLRLATVLIVCVGLALAALAGSLFVGAVDIDLAEGWRALFHAELREGNVSYQILIAQRLPRGLLGFLVGLGLGVAGAALQAILRNPLADPYVLGISTGSALGAVLAMTLGLSFGLGPFRAVEIFALIGAGLVMLLLYRLARRRREFSMNALLLCGVTIALVGSSGILLMRYLAEPQLLVIMDRWMMGGLAIVGYDELAGLFPLLLPGVLLILWMSGALNQLSVGEELAMGRGVDVESTQRWVFAAASLVTAAVVAMAGPIGFVGLIVPHAVRGVVGPDHRLLVPASGLVAGAFLVFCDSLARTVLSPTELPVGVVTSLLGGPVFVYLLLRRSG
ncbi:MAG: iron chelate uptake ABC transporter family permease subunit [Armatimonadia bacterium]|nr:iron chelate uptake ABC transporter family permease subunit [Armatimonadia bacterium]